MFKFGIQREYTLQARRYLLPIWTVAFVIAISNSIVSWNIGGSAWNGRVQMGQYFLGDHGRYTEVSQAVYNYSLVHEVLSGLAIVVALGTVLVLHLHGMLYIPIPEVLTDELPNPTSPPPPPSNELGLPRYPD